MLVRDIMTTPAVTATADTPLKDIAAIMADKNFGCVPVVDAAGKLIGVITESDITGVGRCIPFTIGLAPVIYGARPATASELDEIYRRAQHMKASEVMSDRAKGVREDESIAAVIHLMLKDDLKHMPVVRDGAPVGVVSRHDVLKFALTRLSGKA